MRARRESLKRNLAMGGSEVLRSWGMMFATARLPSSFTVAVARECRKGLSALLLWAVVPEGPPTNGRPSDQ
jgi:hypothetical protein